MAETPPPLRVREADGSPSLIPTYVMTFSGATLTRRSPIEILIQMDSGASGGGAPTDAVYLVGVANGSLSAERVVRAVSGLLIDSTNAGFFDIGLVTPVSVASGGIGVATLNAFGVLYGSGGSAVQALPAMSGGALLIGSGVNFRPHILNTAAQGQYLVTSGGGVGGLAWANTLASGGGPVYAPTGGSYVSFETDAALTNERVLTAGSSVTVTTDGSSVFVTAITAGFTTSARIISFGSGFLVGGGNLSTDRAITYGLPIGVGTGGTGATTFTNRGVLIGSGASAIEALGAMVQGQLMVGSSAVLAPQFLNVGSAGQVLGINNAVALSIAWVNTGAGGAAATKTVLIPLALMTVQPDSANAFWMSVTGTNLDYAFVRFVDSGEGIATYWGRVPFNLAATPAWNLRFYSKTGAAAAGTAIVTTRARSITDAEDIDLAYTIVSSAAPYLIQSANLLTINAVSGGNFDSVVGTSAGDLLMVEINRHGGDTNDVLSNGWDLMGVDMRVDVS